MSRTTFLRSGRLHRRCGGSTAPELRGVGDTQDVLGGDSVRGGGGRWHMTVIERAVSCTMLRASRRLTASMKRRMRFVDGAYSSRLGKGRAQRFDSSSCDSNDVAGNASAGRRRSLRARRHDLRRAILTASCRRFSGRPQDDDRRTCRPKNILSGLSREPYEAEALKRGAFAFFVEGPRSARAGRTHRRRRRPRQPQQRRDEMTEQTREPAVPTLVASPRRAWRGRREALIVTF